MTIADVMTLIGEHNENEDVEWYVSDWTARTMVLTNSYHKCIKFIIKIYDDRIIVRDCNMKTGICCLFKGNDWWNDYKNDYFGLRLAIAETVKYFNIAYEGDVDNG